jgi:spore coat polysaccharide biosynthesis predicted glycosyltransferase SpsG
MIIAEKMVNAFPGSIGVGEIMKIESLLGQLKSRNRIVFLQKILFQDSPVFP